MSFVFFFPLNFVVGETEVQLAFGSQLVMKPGVKPMVVLSPGIFQVPSATKIVTWTQLQNAEREGSGNR